MAAHSLGASALNILDWSTSVGNSQSIVTSFNWTSFLMLSAIASVAVGLSIFTYHILKKIFSMSFLKLIIWIKVRKVFYLSECYCFLAIFFPEASYMGIILTLSKGWCEPVVALLSLHESIFPELVECFMRFDSKETKLLVCERTEGNIRPRMTAAIGIAILTMVDHSVGATVYGLRVNIVWKFITVRTNRDVRELMYCWHV